MTEKEIITKLVDTILAKGREIALDAEGEPFFDASRDRSEILRYIDACDMITVDIGEGEYFLLIWGNEEDIISDFSDTPLCNEIYKEIENA